MRDILLVIDMQNDFVDGNLGSEEAQKIVPNVKKLIENWDDFIFYTLDTHFEKGDGFHTVYEETLEGKKLPVRHCIEGTKGHELVPEVKEALDASRSGIRKFYKKTFGSLVMAKEASLYLWENEKSKDEIHICGLCTDICVLSNALILRAQFPNLKIVCYSNCCAGTSEQAHKEALNMMKSCQIEVVEYE